MIDHVILTVSDFERSVAFYAEALKPLGITNFTDYEGHAGHPDLKGFGDGKHATWVLDPDGHDIEVVHKS
jgi:catechol 2,3-dioxygenase-like lactoylglutathione lyase family enzyme